VAGDVRAPGASDNHPRSAATGRGTVRSGDRWRLSEVKAQGRYLAASRLERREVLPAVREGIERIAVAVEPQHLPEVACASREQGLVDRAALTQRVPIHPLTKLMTLGGALTGVGDAQAVSRESARSGSSCSRPRRPCCSRRLAIRRRRPWWAGSRHPSDECGLPRRSLGREDDAKACLAAHHALVALAGALQWKDFRHRAHAGQRAEAERVLRIDGRPGRPAHD
jgi:hypothetical protein